MRNLNIKDIAKLAGVGVSTVSRVLNQHPDVKQETREHVLKVIEDNNYIPNNSARNLKRNESTDVGIFIKGMYNPFFALMLQTIEEYLATEDYASIIHYNMDHSKRDIDAAHEFIMEKKLKGIICLGGDFLDIDDEDILRLSVPIIFISTNTPIELNKDIFSSIQIDNEKASFDAVNYLCQLGHQKIGIISTGSGDKSTGNVRTEGYIRALAFNNIDKVDERFEVGAYTFESAYEAMNRLLHKAPEITAVFAISDIMAIGAAKAILDHQLKIPQDISLVGFDDIDYAAFFNPTLTTVHQPVLDIAEMGADLMIQLLDGATHHQHQLLETALIVRESTQQID